MSTHPADDRSPEALQSFLDYLADKGLVAKTTILARKASASQILGILDAEEALDITSIDLEQLVDRFARLHGKKYTKESLASYKSRLRSAIGDFSSYLDNPLTFRPSTQGKERSKPKPRQAQGRDASPTTASLAPRVQASPAPFTTSNILPIAIRADLTVYIQGLPFDLTEGEARKIAGVVTAMAT